MTWVDSLARLVEAFVSVESISDLRELMGNICVHGIKAVEPGSPTANGSSGQEVPPDQAALPVALALWRPSLEKAPRPRDTLQDICVGVIAEHFDRLSALSDVSPPRSPSLGTYTPAGTPPPLAGTTSSSCLPSWKVPVASPSGTAGTAGPSSTAPPSPTLFISKGAPGAAAGTPVTPAQRQPVVPTLIGASSAPVALGMGMSPRLSLDRVASGQGTVLQSSGHYAGGTPSLSTPGQLAIHIGPSTTSGAPGAVRVGSLPSYSHAPPSPTSPPYACLPMLHTSLSASSQIRMHVPPVSPTQSRPTVITTSAAVQQQGRQGSSTPAQQLYPLVSQPSTYSTGQCSSAARLGSASLPDAIAYWTVPNHSVKRHTRPAVTLETLPRDLVQRVCEELVVTGQFTLDRLRRLAALDLDAISLENYSNQVHNEWVYCLAQSPRLRYLDLSRCARINDIGMEPIGDHLRGVRVLRLGYCVQISDEGLTHLAGLTHLQELDLQGCDSVTGSGLTHLSATTSLRSLNLNQCTKLATGLAALSGLTSLQSLHLGWCIGLTDEEACHLGVLTGLTSLTLSYTKISDGRVPFLATLTRLKALDMQGCSGVTNESCAVIGKLVGLTSLLLNHCNHVGDQGVSSLTALTHLQLLDLGYTGVTSEGVGAIKSLSSLTHLDLDSCAIEDKGVKALGGLTNLAVLNLADTRIQDRALTYLGRAKGLKRLNISYTQVSNDGLEALRDLRGLEDLNLDSGNISSAGLKHVSHLTALTRLDVFGARVCDMGASHLSHLTRLKRLELCGGSLTDAGCAHLGKLVNLVGLSLAENSRVGDEGVRALTRLSALENLNLNHTHITSAALKEVVKLKSLRHLSLCTTKISEGSVKSLRARAPHLFIKHSLDNNR